MACEHVTLPNGARAIVCGPRRPYDRCRCGRIATLLCDWKLPEDQRGSARKSTTCDKPLCDRCTTSPRPDRDLCPTHVQAFEEWKAARAARAAPGTP